MRFFYCYLLKNVIENVWLAPVCQNVILNNFEEYYIIIRTSGAKKNAIFFNSSRSVVQVSFSSGQSITGHLYKNSIMKKSKNLYRKKRPGK